MRRISGPSSGSRRKRRWKSPRSSSTPSANASARSPSSSSAAPAGAASPSGATGGVDRGRIDRLGPQRRPGRPRLPGPHQHRAALDVKQARGHPAPRPAASGRRSPAATRRARAAAPQPRSMPLSGRAGGRRRGRSGWRRRWRAARGGGRDGAAARPSRRRTARTAATVAAPARTPPAAASAALRTSLRSTGSGGSCRAAAAPAPGRSRPAAPASSSATISPSTFEVTHPFDSSDAPGRLPELTANCGHWEDCGQRPLVQPVPLDDLAAHSFHRPVHRLVRLQDPAHLAADDRRPAPPPPPGA